MSAADETCYLTDLGNAKRLTKRHGRDLRYCHQTRKWYWWDEKRWRVDDNGEVERRAKQSALSILADAAQVDDPQARGRLIEHAEASQSIRALTAAVQLATSEEGIGIAPEQFDADPMMFGAANCVVDLRAGEGRPATREDYITRHSPVPFDPDAECPLWLAFLDRIMGGNADLIGYLQRVAGLVLTGDISVQEMFILHGAGANGKSVFVDVLLHVLSDYAVVAPDSLVAVRSHEEHSTEIAGLMGKRLVVASETEEGTRLKVQKVKQLTGDAILTGRFMRGDFFQFKRSHKLLMTTNHPPRIADTGHAIWRRIKMIPFKVIIPDAEQDPKLLEKLRAEAPGILNWMVSGCLSWQAGGMNAPDEVAAATAAYRADSDPLADFISDRCVRGDEEVRVGRGELFENYRSWAFQAGEKSALDAKAFYAAIRRIPGVDETQKRPLGSTVPVRMFTGIGLAAVMCGAGEDGQ